MSLDEAALVADASRLFAPSDPSLTIGAELELIPVVRETKLPVPMDAITGPSLTALVRRAAERNGWSEEISAAGPPVWNLDGGGRISFEPGGQIEISSEPHRSCSELIVSLQKTARELMGSAEQDGVELLPVGVDPYNEISRVPLLLGGDRYVRMTRYLEARSEFGIRMMRQTAALQISVEHGPRPLERWALLNALAPYLIAIFANSSRYAGSDTGHASYRAHLWRELDRTRTGIPLDGTDAIRGYAEFALDAGAIRAENGTGAFHSFRSLLHDPALAMDDWRFHLSTLFPEIRPKQYFEIRSPDVIAADDLPAPLVFVAGLVYDSRASRDAMATLAEPSERLLRAAGREGLGNAEIRSRAAELIRISQEGASRLPSNYLSAEHREHATEWFRFRLA
jgi:Gamma-glutamylcysteine synthetase